MKLITVCLTIIALQPLACISCPTCVGRIEKDSPAFFNDDFYVKTPAPESGSPEPEENEQREDIE